MMRWKIGDDGFSSNIMGFQNLVGSVVADLFQLKQGLDNAGDHLQGW